MVPPADVTNPDWMLWFTVMFVLAAFAGGAMLLWMVGACVLRNWGRN